MKWFAIGQRLEHQYSLFERGRIFASGRWMEPNGIDIRDAFWCLTLPAWRLQKSWMYEDERWHQAHLIWIRSHGFRLIYWETEA